MNTDVIRERAEDVQDQAQEAVQSFKDKATEWKQSATDCAVDFAKNTDTYFRENPWTAVGIVAAVAFTMGIVIGSRRG